MHPRTRLSMFPLLSLLCAPLAHADPAYSVTPLPAGTFARDINHGGQIVGEMALEGTAHAYLWSGGIPLDLGTLGGRSSIALSVNDAGHVAGYSELNDEVLHAFRYMGGSMLDLGTLGGAASLGLGINAAGAVVGQSSTGANDIHAFLFSNGAMTDIGTLGGSFSSASAINSAGQVVGEASLPGDPLTPDVHAFLYVNGVMTDLGTLGGRLSGAADVNEFGQVVGYAYTSASTERAFLYSDGAMRDLGTLGGRRSFALGINRLGQVVGTADIEGDLERRAFLYSDGVLIDLNALIDPALGWTLIEAAGINDAQQIAAVGCKGDSCHALRLDLIGAIPEPKTGAMLLAGLALLGLSGKISAASRRA